MAETRRPDRPLRIRLEPERRDAVVRALRDFHHEAFDEELSAYRAERVLEFLLKALGPAVYNQAIQDARGFVLEKLEDLDVEFYEDDAWDERGG